MQDKSNSLYFLLGGAIIGAGVGYWLGRRRTAANNAVAFNAQLTLSSKNVNVIFALISSFRESMPRSPNVAIRCYFVTTTTLKYPSMSVTGQKLIWMACIRKLFGPTVKVEHVKYLVGKL